MPAALTCRNLAATCCSSIRSEHSCRFLCSSTLTASAGCCAFACAALAMSAERARQKRSVAQDKQAEDKIRKAGSHTVVWSHIGTVTVAPLLPLMACTVGMWCRPNTKAHTYYRHCLFGRWHVIHGYEYVCKSNIKRMRERQTERVIAQCSGAACNV